MKTHEQIAARIITELRQSGLTYGEMLKVIRSVNEKLENLKKVKR